MTSFATDVLQAVIIDHAWRTAAVIGVAWLITTSMQSLSAQQRRNLWTLALVAVAVFAVAAGTRGVRRLQAGPVPELNAILPLGTDTVRLVVASRATPSARWHVGLLLLSVLGALTAVGRVAADYRRARRITRQAARETDASLLAGLHASAVQAGLSRVPPLLRSSHVATAAVHGLWRSVILVSDEAASWEAAQQRHVLAHEVAHIRARDLPVAAFARLVRAALWWNPLVTFAVRRLEREREFACDAAVIAHGASASDYAETLLDVALMAQRRPVAHALRADGASLPERVAEVLQRTASSSAKAGERRAGRVLAPITLIVCVVIGWWPPLGTALRETSAPQRIDMTRAPRGADGRRRVHIGRDADGRIVLKPTGVHSTPVH